jgi:hypothetical protein
MWQVFSLLHGDVVSLGDDRVLCSRLTVSLKNKRIPSKLSGYRVSRLSTSCQFKHRFAAALTMVALGVNPCFSSEPSVTFRSGLNTSRFALHNGETAKSILCSKAPRAGTLLSELGPRLESLRLVQNALIGPALSRNQVLGRSALKQAGCFEAYGACVGMGTEALDHCNDYRVGRAIVSSCDRCYCFYPC